MTKIKILFSLLIMVILCLPAKAQHFERQQMPKRSPNQRGAGRTYDKNDTVPLVFLKYFEIKLSGRSARVPVSREYSYVFTQHTDYHFFIDEPKDQKGKVQLAVFDASSKEIKLEQLADDDGERHYWFPCDATGIYYLVLFKKDDGQKYQAGMTLHYFRAGEEGNSLYRFKPNGWFDE